MKYTNFFGELELSGVLYLLARPNDLRSLRGISDEGNHNIAPSDLVKPWFKGLKGLTLKELHPVLCRTRLLPNFFSMELGCSKYPSIAIFNLISPVKSATHTPLSPLIRLPMYDSLSSSKAFRLRDFKALWGLLGHVMQTMQELVMQGEQ